ncbi:MAG TPA: zinc ribbon domain-containing protein [Anaerolineales bacterium]|nr:zinc ribbon domain-containing protein [Anaerolineales bacterium]
MPHPINRAIIRGVVEKEQQGEKQMPVYTYRCEACGVQFERHQSFTDTPLKTCPECRKKALKKVITPTKIIFKGSGFYATDHKSPSGESSSTSSTKKTSKKEKDSAPKESASTESKSPSGGDSE